MKADGVKTVDLQKEVAALVQKLAAKRELGFKRITEDAVKAHCLKELGKQAERSKDWQEMMLTATDFLPGEGWWLSAFEEADIMNDQEDWVRLDYCMKGSVVAKRADIISFVYDLERIGREGGRAELNSMPPAPLDPHRASLTVRRQGNAVVLQPVDAAPDGPKATFSARHIDLLAAALELAAEAARMRRKEIA